MEEFNVEGLRSFVDGEGEVNYINSPTAEDIRSADWEYSKTYTKSLIEGIMTTEELKDLLRARGIIGPEFDQRAEELTEILAKKLGVLESVESATEKQAVAIDVSEARDALFSWNQRLQAPLANTCEQMADDARLESLTSGIIVNAVGSKVWPTFDDYLTEQNQGKQQKARFEVMLYLQGLSSDFLEQTPEAVAMREAKEAIAVEVAEITEPKSKKKTTKK